MPFDSYPKVNRKPPEGNSQKIELRAKNSDEHGDSVKSQNFMDFNLPSHNHVKFQPLLTFEGSLAVSHFDFATQNFSLQKKDEHIFIQNYPTNAFPKIEIVMETAFGKLQVREFNIQPSEDSVQGEILYTRLFLIITENKHFSLHFKDVNIDSLNFSFSEVSSKEKKEMLFRAKLFRKLGFIEKVFPNTKFVIPKDISADDVRQTEILYRGITEGEFSIPAGDSITVFNYILAKGDLENLSIPKRKSFSFEFNEDLLVLGKFFPIGKMAFKVDKASIANPRVLKNFSEGDILPSLRLKIFDYQVKHRLEKYLNKDRLQKNKLKLEQFKKALRQEEPDYLVDLIDEPLAEINKKSAIEIVEGLLQYQDFPDRFSVLEPEFEENRWRVPVALTYPKYEPIWLADAFIDAKTGKFEMKISFEELLEKGKKKAQEVFSFA